MCLISTLHLPYNTKQPALHINTNMSPTSALCNRTLTLYQRGECPKILSTQPRDAALLGPSDSVRQRCRFKLPPLHGLHGLRRPCRAGGFRVDVGACVVDVRQASLD